MDTTTPQLKEEVDIFWKPTHKHHPSGHVYGKWRTNESVQASPSPSTGNTPRSQVDQNVPPTDGGDGNLERRRLASLITLLESKLTP